MGGRHGYSKTALEETRRARGRESARRHPVRARLRFVTALLVLVGMVLAMATLLGLPSYDRAHPVTVDCTLDAVAVGTTSGKSGHRPYIRFSTSDCGTLVLFDDVTADNQGDLAAELEQGHRYRVTVGGGTYRFRSVLAVLRIRPTIEHYERLS
ncbi:hypothetical protein [Curtobacterium sp. MCBD17_032]|uniref:hypothetical protein n=1 Tax=Curtobacterium sp. MCBD17_032 TaxID=2175659 RepID=UPI000DA94901|nr:hypothetical protein [Curtobacterium sp. MCBD17_032]PZE84139.1 hypothetical protein DEI91_09595 [Curtobacterium sp. MCBD17_032]